ncbi:MAG: serine hydrolase, partial [Bacteroidota bacterium]
RRHNKWIHLLLLSIYYAAGFGGNFIVIDKKNDLIIVTRWLEPNKIGEMVELVHNSLK